MRDQNVGFLPVCEQRTKPVGTITDRDIAIRVVAEDKPNTTPVDQVMTSEVISARPDDDLQTAQELMAKHHKSRIMCVDDRGMLVGVISLSDIAQHEDQGRASRTLREVSEREARA
jgi:CBS domain-containing protein